MADLIYGDAATEISDAKATRSHFTTGETFVLA